MIKAIVIGGAPSTWAELERAKQYANYDLVIAVNRSGVDYSGHVDHWVSYHPENFKEWVDERESMGHEPVEKLWTSLGKPLPKGLLMNTLPSWGGSSGLFAVAVALHHQADKIILCGVPLDQKQGHYHDKSAWGTGDWAEATKYRPAWNHNMPSIKDKVRSMSGWTMRHLGAPTLEWLGG